MQKIEAIIQPFKLEDVKNALKELGTKKKKREEERRKKKRGQTPF